MCFFILFYFYKLCFLYVSRRVRYYLNKIFILLVLKSEWGFELKNKLSDDSCIYFYEAESVAGVSSLCIMPEAGTWEHKIQRV